MKGHTILVVEDDPGNAKELVGRLEALGHTCLKATNVEQALAIAESQPFCCASVDIEIPNRANEPAFEEGGHRVVETIRKNHPRFDDAKRCHLLPIVAISAHVEERKHLALAYESGVDANMKKPVVYNDPPLKVVFERLFERSGRSDHANCERRTLESRAARAEAKRLLGISAKKSKQRRLAELEGRPLPLQKAPFFMVVRLALGQIESPDGFVDREALGKPEDLPNWPGPKLLKKDVADAGFDPETFYENARGKEYRLHPTIAVDWTAVDLDVLATHDDERVQAIAREIRERRSR